MSNRRLQVIFGLVLLAALFVLVNMLAGNLFRSSRIDLTESKLYTLSEGTRNIITQVEEPITMHFFFSDQATEDVPFLRAYAVRVRELLQEYEQLSEGKIKLNITDPIPYSEEEDQATELGLQAVPIGDESVYFGLAASNAIGNTEMIAFFQPNREQFLEYDLSKLVHNLVSPKKPVIGVISSLPLFSSFDMQTQQITDPWSITSQLQQLYEVRNVSVTTNKIDEDIDVLMIVHPKQMSQSALYAIDQFALRGGSLLLFIDPHSEVEAVSSNSQQPIEAAGARTSDFKKLLSHWGVEFDSNWVVGDRKHALLVNDMNGRQVRHYALLGFVQDSFAQKDIVTADLDMLTVSVAGHLQLKEGASVEFTPLLTTSDETKLFERDTFRFLPKISILARDFEPTGERYTVAARIQHQPTTAFPEGPPTIQDSEEGEELADQVLQHLSGSKQPVNAVIVADTDLLADRMWVEVQSFLGQKVFDAWASNGNFVTNAIDNLLGSADLIAIRSREVSTRPFERVEQLRREAEERYSEQEQVLQNRLRDTEQKLAQLQSQRTDQGNQLLSPEQSREIQRFQEENLQVRKELRKVRHELDKNIQSLGSVLKAINIGAVPLLITVFALVLSFVRMNRRKKAAT